MVAGIALMVWGSVELFIVDKTLRPRLVGGPVKLPFLPTFFGLVGGVKTMGIVGPFVGPVLMALRPCGANGCTTRNRSATPPPASKSSGAADGRHACASKKLKFLS